MKIESGYTMWEGCWLECALCADGLRAYEVESYTQLPGELAQAPVCRRCVIGEQWLKQWLGCRPWKLRDLADRLEQACEEGIEVLSLGELHNLERRRRAGFPRNSPQPQIFTSPNDKRGKRGRVTQRGLLP